MKIRMQLVAQPPRTRGGFTLVELMVVIAIVAILIALLLPAIQSAREAARRISCTNNIRQIALATQSYESDQKKLPPSGIVDPAFAEYAGRQYPVFDQQKGQMLGWAVLLLPYMGEDGLYSRFDMTLSVLEQTGEPQEAFVPTFNCPSDSEPASYYSDPDRTYGKRFSKGNYAAYVSPFHSDLQILYPAAITYGGQPLANITDGSAKTIVFSEVRTLVREDDERGVWALPWNGSSLLAFDAHAQNAKSINFSAAPFGPITSLLFQAQLPNTLGPNQDILMHCEGEHAVEAQLRGMPCLTWKWALGLSGYSSAAPRSNHFGGVNVAYLDGHVDFLTNSVNPETMAYLIAIRDGRDL
jgi:prepilin-type N-terminal cleavage/methylation domain-containing protein/prepilin-type processing-associated H-X9-DG protein